MPVVGFVHGGAAHAFSGRIAAFRVALGEAGYIEGQNVAIEYHWLEGHFERLPAVMADLVRRRVAVIATPGSTPVSLAAKAATTNIPIVFGVSEDAVALGMVSSLSQPGGNARGINFFVSEIDAETVAVLHHSRCGSWTPAAPSGQSVSNAYGIRSLRQPDARDHQRPVGRAHEVKAKAKTAASAVRGHRLLQDQPLNLRAVELERL